MRAARTNGLLVTALALQAGCVHLMYPARDAATEILYTTTDDGWELAVHHFAPAPGLPPRRHPVIICHGLASNKNNWDLTDRLSFPAYLTDLGFDVWGIELRGGGLSETPGWFSEKGWDFTFDDYVLHDIPAALALVREKTGAEQVHWIGHSMGGIVMYGYLQRVGDQHIRSAAAIGSPPWLLDHANPLNASYTWLPVLDFFFDEIPTGTLAQLLSPLAAYQIVPHTHIIWNRDNVSPQAARTAAANAVSNQSANVMVQLARTIEDHALRSFDGTYDYRAGLANITVPFFFGAGALDHLAPPAVVMDAYRHVSSEHKAVVVFSRANGFANDYGHVDLVVGESAPLDVFPVLSQWVIEHD